MKSHDSKIKLCLESKKKICKIKKNIILVQNFGILCLHALDSVTYIKAYKKITINTNFGAWFERVSLSNIILGILV